MLPTLGESDTQGARPCALTAGGTRPPLTTPPALKLATATTPDAHITPIAISSSAASLMTNYTEHALGQRETLRQEQPAAAQPARLLPHRHSLKGSRQACAAHAAPLVIEQCHPTSNSPGRSLRPFGAFQVRTQKKHTSHTHTGQQPDAPPIHTSPYSRVSATNRLSRGLCHSAHPAMLRAGLVVYASQLSAAAHAGCSKAQANRVQRPQPPWSAALDAAAAAVSGASAKHNER